MLDLLPEDLLLKLEAQDPEGSNGPGGELTQDEELVLAKLYTPDANWTWYIVSASRDAESGEIRFFGLVEGLETELGYFTLSQLHKVFATLGLPVELDKHWQPIPLMRLMEDLEESAA